MSFYPTAASFLVSEACNLNCSYCFESHKKPIKMSRDVALKSYYILIENARKSNQKAVALTMFGGEPMLNFPIIEAIIDESRKILDIQTQMTIITNGTILTTHMAKFLKENQKHLNLNIQLSVDGTENIHDFYRVTNEGGGSFKMIEKNLPLFKSIFNEDYDNNPHPALHIHGSLNKKTMYKMYESWKFFREVWKTPYVWFMPIHAEKWDLEDVKSYEEQSKSITLDLVQECLITRSSHPMKYYAPIDKCLGLQPRNGHGKTCGAGSSYITFTAKGDIYPCHEFYYIDEETTKIGHVDIGIDWTKVLLFTEIDGSESNCVAIGCKNYDCYRCYAENYKMTGTIFNPHHNHRCRMSSVERKLIFNANKILKAEGLI